DASDDRAVIDSADNEQRLFAREADHGRRRPETSDDVHESNSTAWRRTPLVDRVGVAAGRYSDGQPVDRRGEPGERVHHAVVEVFYEAKTDVDAVLREPAARDANDLRVGVGGERVALDQSSE